MAILFIYISIILTIYVADEYIVTKLLGPLFNMNVSYVYYFLAAILAVLAILAVEKMEDKFREFNYEDE